MGYLHDNDVEAAKHYRADANSFRRAAGLPEAPNFEGFKVFGEVIGRATRFFSDEFGLTAEGELEPRFMRNALGQRTNNYLALAQRHPYGRGESTPIYDELFAATGGLVYPPWERPGDGWQHFCACKDGMLIGLANFNEFCAYGCGVERPQTRGNS